jgi:hypothetical protein
VSGEAQRSDTLGELAKAIVEVMKEVKGVEKNTEVGAGTSSSYKGVSDKDAKEVIRAAMIKHGLAILPVRVDATATVERWSEDTGKWGVKQKQSVFTEAAHEVPAHPRERRKRRDRGVRPRR